jgi:toxin ParE1/3/4
VAYTVLVGALAIEDLQALHAYIAIESSNRMASAYLARIEQACRSLETFPALGRARDDLAPGLRTLSFEGRALIGYRIDGKIVTIERILYGGRDVDAAF